MLLALWADFWNLADWVPAPPPVVVPVRTEGGHGGYTPRRDYEWWDEYETMLRRHHPVHVEERAPVKVKRAAKQRNTLIAKVQTHHPPSVEALREVNSRIEALTREIENFATPPKKVVEALQNETDALQSDDEEAVLALLLS